MREETRKELLALKELAERLSIHSSQPWIWRMTVLDIEDILKRHL